MEPTGSSSRIIVGPLRARNRAKSFHPPFNFWYSSPTYSSLTFISCYTPRVATSNECLPPIFHCARYREVQGGEGPHRFFHLRRTPFIFFVSLRTKIRGISGYSLEGKDRRITVKWTSTRDDKKSPGVIYRSTKVSLSCINYLVSFFPFWLINSVFNQEEQSCHALLSRIKPVVWKQTGVKIANVGRQRDYAPPLSINLDTNSFPFHTFPRSEKSKVSTITRITRNELIVLKRGAP